MFSAVDDIEIKQKCIFQTSVLKVFFNPFSPVDQNRYFANRVDPDNEPYQDMHSSTFCVW